MSYLNTFDNRQMQRGIGKVLFIASQVTAGKYVTFAKEHISTLGQLCTNFPAWILN